MQVDEPGSEQNYAKRTAVNAQIGYLLAASIGIAMATQGIWLAEMYEETDVFITLAISSFVTTVAGIVLVLLGFGEGELTGIKAVPLYVILGSGLAGAWIVGGVGRSVNITGPAAAFTLIIAFQLFASVLYEHFGWFDVEVRKFDLWRLAGLLLVVAGSFLLLARKPGETLKELF